MIETKKKHGDKEMKNLKRKLLMPLLLCISKDDRNG